MIVRHATDFVEHSELVADRLITFTEIVGQENVIAGTDCGLGGRVHPRIAWAKLRACATAPREQEIAELKSRVPDRDQPKQKARKSRK